jgi:hypothetical protein
VGTAQQIAEQGAPKLDSRNTERRSEHGITKAGSNPAPSPLPGWPKPSDKWNWSYSQFLELEKQAGRVAYWVFEPWSMWLAGGVRYKPDFLIVYPDGLERKPRQVTYRADGQPIGAPLLCRDCHAQPRMVISKLTSKGDDELTQCPACRERDYQARYKWRMGQYKRGPYKTYRGVRREEA